MVQDLKLDELYQQIKQLGTKAETLVNGWIRERLNQEEVASLASTRSKHYAKRMKDLQNAIEMVSIPLNLPTKRDVTNLARLTIQNEDKLLQIQEELQSLKKSVKQIESLLLNQQPSAQPDRLKLVRSEKAKKVQENLERLSQALLQPPKFGA